MMNVMRGDVSADFAGRERCFRLTFDGLAAIEARLAAGIVAVAERFPARTVGTSEVTAILSEGLKGGGGPVDEPAVRAGVMELGFAESARLAGRILAAGLGAGEVPAGEGKS